MRIREGTYGDIDDVLQMDQLWDEEQITHHFIHYSRQEVVAYLERSPVSVDPNFRF
ncbi:hypothetical protein KFU94_00220 [Chloroflexi bacterium TSY]|nr:hypothetical protein [Chloroflexi bacterium TSY]